MSRKSGVDVTVSLKELLYGEIGSSTIEKYHFVYSNIEKYQQILLKEFENNNKNTAIIVFDLFGILLFYNPKIREIRNLYLQLSENDVLYLDYQDINGNYSNESLIRFIKDLPFTRLLESFQAGKLDEYTDYYIIFDNLSVLQILNDPLPEIVKDSSNSSREDRGRSKSSISVDIQDGINYESVMKELHGFCKILSTNKNSTKLFTASFTKEVDNFEIINIRQLNNTVYKYILKNDQIHNDAEIYLSDDILKLKNKKYFDKIIIID